MAHSYLGGGPKSPKTGEQEEFVYVWAMVCEKIKLKPNYKGQSVFNSIHNKKPLKVQIREVTESELYFQVTLLANV